MKPAQPAAAVLRILCVAGARPDFMQMAPIMAALAEPPAPVAVKLVLRNGCRAS